ncbi:hypothetical protein QT970_08900 [Microcoleus sp. herbarium8]|uniref:hypothetical protein n=1 Tax=Microcoleus sp. herbarium8 TaxID=3055436 RepID=UPI002FD61BBC
MLLGDRALTRAIEHLVEIVAFLNRINNSPQIKNLQCRFPTIKTSQKFVGAGSATSQTHVKHQKLAPTTPSIHINILPN